MGHLWDMYRASIGHPKMANGLNYWCMNVANE
jgi:hypothetical protein